MKPLNRPMFKYGGPIKEGIMTGMKDNRQAINTVGSPLAPKDETGRGGYAFPLIPAAITAGRFLLRPLVRYGANVLRRAPTTGKGGQRLLPKPGEGPYSPVKPVFDPNVAVPTKFGSYLLRSPEGRLITGGAGFAGKVGKKAIGAGKYLASSPLTVGSAGVYGAKGLYNALTGEKEPEVQKEIEAAGGPPGGGDPNMFARSKEKIVNQEELEKMNKDRIQKNKERYYKLMGIDKMSKDAIYDSLIDASKIISEEGADLKGAVKSGTLQNRIIQAISGQLDKSAALKRQIDAAVLKGEIEKDIKASDPTAQKRADLIDKQIALADKSLAGDTLQETVNKVYEKTGAFPSGASLTAVARTKGIEISSTADTTEVKNYMRDNKGKDEIDYLEEAVSKGTPDGNYVINNRILVVKDGKVIPYL